jgi:Na+/proline symporter
MSWWLLGISMVATTFAADTPNLVTELVRKNGVSGNWAWWSFLLTGLLTVFVYAKLWKRSGVLTDLEFYERRYSGRPAAFLRGFRAIYLGVVFNCLVMSAVILAAIKLSGMLLGIGPVETVLITGTVTVIYTLLGGLRGVILTDCFQFLFAMVGAVAAAAVICNQPEIGGFANLLAHENVAGKLSLFPDFNDTNVFVAIFVIPLAIQWWSSWYPGAEPGGGGYVAQRMLSAKSESDAATATLLFVVAHYALRPWPWIIVALASLVVYPDLASIGSAFPDIPKNSVRDDLAYPAMLTRLPSGLLGVVTASLAAAFMSTISTHLNWGGSYLAHDFYHRFVNPQATEKQLVRIGRSSTVGLMAIASLLALSLESALDGFSIILQIGAGTGLIYILRWFWWRINAFTEIAGMAASLGVALSFRFIYPSLSESLGLPALEDWHQMVIGVGLTTAIWLLTTFLTRPTDPVVLESFYQSIRPGGRLWGPVHDSLAKRGIEVESDHSLTAGILAMVICTFLVYSLLFGVGYVLYGQTFSAILCFVVATTATIAIVKIWPQLKMT